MSTELTNKDYTSILNFYKMKIPKSKRLLKKQAEQIMAEKLCRCIKKVDLSNEAKSIGICTKTIFNNKGYTRGKFTCKKNRTVKFRRS
jgi:hypothetical protein